MPGQKVPNLHSFAKQKKFFFLKLYSSKYIVVLNKFLEMEG